MKKVKTNNLTIVLSIIYLLALILIILFKLPFSYAKIDKIRNINLIPLLGSINAEGSINWAEIVSNILIFIPLGIYIGILKDKWYFIKKVIVIIGFTLTFEILQFICAIGRTDITDVLSNTLGGLIGIGIYTLAFKLLKDKTTIIINTLALVLTVCALFLFAFFFTSSHRTRPQGGFNHLETISAKTVKLSG